MSLDLSYIPPKARILVAALVVTGSTVVGIADYEGYFDKASIPIKGDVYTIGYGSTKNVKKGDTITPQRALHRLNDDINIFATKLRGCITAPLYDYEWAAYLTLSYNIGTGAFCTKAKKGEPPNIIDLINAGRYEEACARIDKFNGVYREDSVGNRYKVIVPGLVTRRAAERKICEGPVKVLH